MYPTRDLAHNPGMDPDWELNQQTFGSQAGTQSTEPHQPRFCLAAFISWGQGRHFGKGGLSEFSMSGLSYLFPSVMLLSNY